MMDYQNVLEIPGVTVSFEYRLWGSSVWITDAPNPIEISDGKLVVDNLRNPTGGLPAWWNFRVKITGISYPAAIRIAYDTQQTSFYGDYIFAGAFGGEYSLYVYGASSGTLDGAAPIGDVFMGYEAGYDAGRIRGEFTMLLAAVPPFWQKFVYSKEII